MFEVGQSWGTASPNALTEASGIAASRRNAGVLWTHNDGSRERIFALSTNGALLAGFNLNENVDDVEDLAASSNDIGSPGRILTPATSPILRITRRGDTIRIAFGIAVGRRYSLEVRNDLLIDPWTPTADSFQAADNGVGYFEKTISDGNRFYRVLVE